MLNITVEGKGLIVNPNAETIFTVFPNNENEMPQDFETYEKAEEYANTEFGVGNYQIAKTL